MNDPRRFQVDISPQEHETLKQIAKLAGLRTENDVFCNAIALFKWAAKESIKGRRIASINENLSEIRQFVTPALMNISDQAPMVSIAEFRRRASETGRPLAEILDDLESMARFPRASSSQSKGLKESGGPEPG